VPTRVITPVVHGCAYETPKRRALRAQ